MVSQIDDGENFSYTFKFNLEWSKKKKYKQISPNFEINIWLKLNKKINLIPKLKKLLNKNHI